MYLHEAPLSVLWGAYVGVGLRSPLKIRCNSIHHFQPCPCQELGISRGSLERKSSEFRGPPPQRAPGRLALLKGGERDFRGPQPLVIRSLELGKWGISWGHTRALAEAPGCSCRLRNSVAKRAGREH